MSAREAAPVPEERITLDDIKHRTEEIKDLAVSQTKDAAARVMAMDATRKALIVAGVAVAVISLAFLMGTRSGRDRV
jgi:hypothetical protein